MSFAQGLSGSTKGFVSYNGFIISLCEQFVLLSIYHIVVRAICFTMDLSYRSVSNLFYYGFIVSLCEQFVLLWIYHIV